MLLMKALAGNQFTAKLPLAQRRLLVTYMAPAYFKTDEVIIREGEPGDELYIIAEGVLLASRSFNSLTETGSPSDIEL